MSKDLEGAVTEDSNADVLAFSRRDRGRLRKLVRIAGKQVEILLMLRLFNDAVSSSEVM
jgi:hypothetical protein